MDFEIFKEKLIKKATEKGFESCEVYYAQNEKFALEVFKESLQKYTDATSSGLSFRGLYNGKMGYSYSEIIKEEFIDKIIDEAIFNAMLLESVEEEFIFEGEKEYDILPKIPEDSTPTEDKIKMTFDIEKAVKDYSDKVESVTVHLGNGKYVVSISNSKGLNLTEETTGCIAYISTNVSNENEKKSSFEYWFGTSFKDLDINELATKGTQKALDKLGEKTVKSGKYRLLLTKEVVFDLLQTFYSMFVAEQVQKGFSLLKGEVGNKILSELITINDFGVVEGSLARSTFDSEGVKTKDVVVVEKGVLKSYLYNLKTAKVDGCKSTGNGFRGSYKAGINTTPKNFFIEKGELPFSDMVKKLDNGIIIESLQGLHSGANAVSGEFSLQAYGKLVENGKIIRPVDSIVISGSFLDMFKQVEVLGSDFAFDINGGATCFGAPSIIVTDVSVAGE